MPATKVSFNLIDYSGEQTSTQVYVEEMDSSNYDDVVSAVDALQTALLLATDCNHVSTSISLLTDTTPAVPAPIATAQREIAIRVKYVDAVNGRYGNFTVPGPAIGFYPPQGVKDDFVPLNNLIFSAFIGVIEANMVSRDGNSIEVVEGRLVGRNN